MTHVKPKEKNEFASFVKQLDFLSKKKVKPLGKENITQGFDIYRKRDSRQVLYTYFVLDRVEGEKH